MVALDKKTKASAGPDFSIERALRRQLDCDAGFRIAGIDEAGRGPWAGPVVAAAVVFDAEALPASLAGLDDSKKLSRARREALLPAIVAHAAVGIGAASAIEIDEINILQATYLAMRRAVADLSEALNADPDFCLVDGNRDPGLGLPTRTVVKGDARSLSIAAASVVAKVHRDKIMAGLARDYPAYGWEQNAGYGVPHHRDALNLVGPSPHHRKSFAPVRESMREDSLIKH